MKQKYISGFVFFLITCFASINGFAQCTPDTAMAKGSILPEQLPYAYNGNAYSEVIYFKAPLDTNVNSPFGPVTVRIDSMVILNVIGLPSTFNYVCNEPSCTIKGGEAGCLTLAGTPAAMNNYPIKVVIKTYATIKGFDIPSEQTDTNTKYTLYVFGTVGLSQNDPLKNVNVYPNPASEKLFISSFENEPVTATLLSITGSIVRETKVPGEAGFDLKGLSKGLYFLRLETVNESAIRKIIVE